MARIIPILRPLISSSKYTLVSAPSQATFTTGNVGFKLATSGDAIAVDFCQCENNGYPSTPLVTTAASVSRGIDEPAHGDPNGVRPNLQLIRTIMCNGAPWSVFFSASGNSPTGGVYQSDGGVTIVPGTSGGLGSFTSNAISSGKHCE
jgi:hypothetical protein